MTYSVVNGLMKDLGRQGFEPPATAQRIVIARAAVAAASDRPRAADALRQAVADGDDRKAREALRDYAAAHSTGEAYQVADSGAADALRETLTPSAWEFAAERYNKAGASFMRATKTVDPEADPDTLDGKVFSTWKSIPGLTRELDLAAALLAAVAGTLHDVSTSRSTGSASALGLYAPEGGDSDALSSIWRAGTPKGRRGGIWGSLVAAGAVLRAPASHVEHSARFDEVPEVEMPKRDLYTPQADDRAVPMPEGYVEAAIEQSTPPDDAGEDYDSFANAVRVR